MADLLGTLILGAIICVIMALVGYLKTNAFEKSQNNMVFDKTANKLIIYNRTYSNSDKLSMERHREIYNKYNPATVTYTGATVGGITTGGLNYNPAYYSTGLGNYTDKYELWYKGYDKDDMHWVSKIELTSKDAEQAKIAGLIV